MLAGEQPHRPANLAGRHPGDGLRPLRGIASRELPEQLQGGPAADRLPVGAGEAVGPGQRGLDSVLAVPAVDAVGRRISALAIPDEEALRVSGRGEVLPGQQLSSILPHQERSVGPVADEVLVVETLLEQYVDHAQSERAVGARPDWHPQVGFAGERRLARINDDQLGAACCGQADPHRHGRPGRPRVEAPQQDAAGMLVVRWGGAYPVGVFRAPVPVPLANVGVRHDVGAPEGIGQAPGPRHKVIGRTACRGCNRKGHCLGPMAGLDLQEARRRQRQRLVPGDAGPARVGIALGARADHGIPQAVRGVDDLRSRRSLHADAPVRVRRIRGHLRQDAVADGSHHTAAGHAHGAVGVNLLDGHRSPCQRSWRINWGKGQSAQCAADAEARWVSVLSVPLVNLAPRRLSSTCPPDFHVARARPDRTSAYAAHPRHHTDNGRSCQAEITARPPGWSSADRTGARPSMAVITARYHALRAWFRRMADFGLWMSPQNPRKSASAAGGPHKNPTYKTALPGTRRHGC